MKKILLTTVIALAVTGSALAQGNINWSGIPFASMTAETNGMQYSPLFGGAATGTGTIGPTVATAGAFYYELLYTAYSGTQAPVPTTLAGLESWSDAGASAESAAAAGKLSPLNANAGYTVPWSPGTTDSIVLVGWSANLGTSWSGAISNLTTFTTFAPGSFFGATATGYITTFATTTTPGAVVFNGAATISGLPINSPNTQLYELPVPEPATMALSGLGGLALLLIRRRK